MPLDFGKLERAAAEIADDAIRLVEARDHAEGGQFGFALAREDLDLSAANGFGFRDESLAVLRFSACGSSDRP